MQKRNTIGEPRGPPLTCQPRSRKLTYSSCFLQACLWSVLLFSAGEQNAGRDGSTHVRQV